MRVLRSTSFRRPLVYLAALALAAAPSAVRAQTADEVIAKNLQALGGAEKLKSLKSVRMSGRMTVGPGMEAPMVAEQVRPDRVRMEITVQGLTLVQAFDGTTGWMINPFQGKRDAERMPDDDVKALREMADMDGPLVDYKAKGNTVELLGKEAVDGSEAYKVKVTLKDGETRTYYFDADSWLQVKMESKRMVRGAEQEGETTFGNFKPVGGLLFPHQIVGGAKGAPQKQTITVEKIELDPAIDAARFTMPAAQPAPAPKP